jgi:hypothetical protein
MDDLSNRDLSQVPDEDLTPAERAELKRRLDSFVDVMRRQVFDGRRVAPRARAATKPDRADQDERG